MRKFFILSVGGPLLMFLMWIIAASCNRDNYEVLFSDIHLYPSTMSSTGDYIKLNENEHVGVEELKLVLKLDFHNFVVSNNSLLPKAYAALPPIYNKLDQAKEIKLITLHDYDATHPAGTDVIDLIKDIDTNDTYNTNRKKIINIINDSGYFLRDYEEIEMQFISSPTNSNQIQKFAFEILTVDGSVLRDTTINFYID